MHERDEEDEEEQVMITLPANALETFGAPLSGQFSNGHSTVENNSSILAASAARGEPFPCFKRSPWGDRLILKVIQQHSAPGAA